MRWPMSDGSREADRYRRVAEDALKVLDWCIWYFRYEGQPRIAERLEQNRAHIRERLKGGAAQAAPPQPEQKPVQKIRQALGLGPKKD